MNKLLGLLFLLPLALFAVHGHSQTIDREPGVTYNTIGNTTYGSDGSSQTVIGDNVFHSDGSSHFKV